MPAGLRCALLPTLRTSVRSVALRSCCCKKKPAALLAVGSSRVTSCFQQNSPSLPSNCRQTRVHSRTDFVRLLLYLVNGGNPPEFCPGVAGGCLGRFYSARGCGVEVLCACVFGQLWRETAKSGVFFCIYLSSLRMLGCSLRWGQPGAHDTRVFRYTISTKGYVLTLRCTLSSTCCLLRRDSPRVLASISLPQCVNEHRHLVRESVRHSRGGPPSKSPLAAHPT